MKAKELAEIFLKENDFDKAALDLFKYLVFESEDIIKNRNVKSDSGCLSVIREQNNKWKAVCRIINKDEEILNKNGFEIPIQNEMGIII